jgi:hypothetical protein
MFLVGCITISINQPPEVGDITEFDESVPVVPEEEEWFFIIPDEIPEDEYWYDVPEWEFEDKDEERYII